MPEHPGRGDVRAARDLIRAEVTTSVSPDTATTILAGVDRVELSEFRRVLDVGGPQLLDNIYSAREREHCNGRVAKLATRFAAKEATTKVLGTGVRGIGLHEIEVETSSAGQPILQLHGRARARAADLGIVSISVSLSHTSVAAEAFVVALSHSTTTQPTAREEKLQ
jgi:holo-[acyl-carrier protein] synthase